MLNLLKGETMKTTATAPRVRIASHACRLIYRVTSGAAPAVFLSLTLLAPPEARACASCGCTLSSDAAMGYSALAGWRLSVEYDYIHQDQLRSGTRSVSGVPDGYELERETLNRYITTGLTYAPSSNWNVSLFVPYVGGDHRGSCCHRRSADWDALLQPVR